MEKVAKILNSVILLVILGLLIWFMFQMRKGNEALQNQAREYWEDPKFVPDTIIAGFDYSQLPKPIYKNYVPPKVVINYPETPTTGFTLELRDSLISIINEVTGERDSIAQAYILLYPKASKLIYGQFSLDSLVFDLLDPSGAISTSVYPVNYQRFTYQYRDAKLHAFQLPPRLVPKRLQQNLYGYVGYAPTYGNANLGVDYSLSKGQLRLQAESFMTIEQSPQFYLGINAGWKLYGRN